MCRRAVFHFDNETIHAVVVSITVSVENPAVGIHCQFATGGLVFVAMEHAIVPTVTRYGLTIFNQVSVVLSYQGQAEGFVRWRNPVEGCSQQVKIIFVVAVGELLEAVVQRTVRVGTVVIVANQVEPFLKFRASLVAFYGDEVAPVVKTFHSKGVGNVKALRLDKFP